MGWHVRVNFTDGSSEEVDEVFDSRTEAEAEADSWLDSWNAGRETLDLAGEPSCDADIQDFDIWKD